MTECDHKKRGHAFEDADLCYACALEQRDDEVFQ